MTAGCPRISPSFCKSSAKFPAKEGSPLKLSDILLVTDCDGTLLRGDKTVSDADRAAIAAWKAKGGKFTIATGRSLPTAAFLLESLPLDLPVILYNGAMLYDPIAKRPLWTAEIPPEAHIAAEKAAKRFSASAGMEVLTPEGLYAVRVTPMIEEHLGGLQKVLYRKASFAELGQKRWLKVMIALPEEEMDALRAFLEGLCVPGVRFVRSERYYFEMLPAMASKGAALTALCARCGISLAHTVAIGDCDNDLEMLEAAGAGYAVANAYPSVRAKAGRTTCSNEEGAVAAVIAELLSDPEAVFSSRSNTERNDIDGRNPET